MVTATFKRGDSIVGTASGAVNEIPAKGTKTAELLSMDGIDGYDTVKLEPSGCYGGAVVDSLAGKTGSGPRLSFGKPTLKLDAEMGMHRVLVEATNKTDRTVTCMLTATFKKGDGLLGTASGALNQVPAGSTRTRPPECRFSAFASKSLKFQAVAARFSRF